MKCLIIGDVHYAQNSSLVRGQNEILSERLEMCNRALNWVEQLGVEKQVDEMIYLGDFFDTPTLNAMEITGLTQIQWNNKPHRFICGNHEMGRNDLLTSSAHTLKLLGFDLITQPKTIGDIHYLPYNLEPTLETYNNEKIILSHNDIKGINLGGYITKHGLELDDINCFFVNGHIHNGTELKKNVFNLGNFVGQNFGEDAFKYKHQVMLLDTDTLEYELIENPYTFQFYKIKTLKELDEIKPNAIVSITTKNPDSFKKKIKTNPNILYSRVITEIDVKGVQKQEQVDLSIDHHLLFRNYISETIGEKGLVELDKI